MAYLVLARKYRPQVFEDVIGQHHVTQTLQNAIAGSRVAHAFLFAGPRGVGKTSAARILAKSLNCTEGPTASPCGQCEPCREISSGTSIDVIEIDGASNRGINEIRELRENVKYAPARGKHKIFIIDEVHMLTQEAFNALLKTLEEPPAHVIFMFATTEPYKIPITILSRCQRFDFRRIPLGEIVQRLTDIATREGVTISENSVRHIAKEAEGSMRDAQSLLDQVISFSGNEVRDDAVAEVLGLVDRRLLYDLSLAIARRDSPRCFGILDTLDQYGYDFRQFSKDLLNHFRNLMVVHMSKSPETLLDLTAEEVAELIEQSKEFGFRHAQQCLNVLLRSDADLSRTAFPKLTLEMALLKMVDMQPVVAVDELLDRLDVLETRLSKSESDFGEEDQTDPSDLMQTSWSGTSKESVPAAEDTFEAPESPDEESRLASAGNLEGTWVRLLEATNRQKPVLGALLSHGRLMALSDHAIEIGFKKGSFYDEKIRDEENKKAVKEIVRSLLGRDVHVTFSIACEDAQAAASSAKERETDRDRHLRKKVLENPIVKDALEILGGEIEDIKVGTHFEPQ